MEYYKIIKVLRDSEKQVSAQKNEHEAKDASNNEEEDEEELLWLLSWEWRTKAFIPFSVLP